MIVSHDQSGAILPQRMPKELANPYEAGIERSNIDRGDREHVVLGVQKHQPQVLLIQK